MLGFITVTFILNIRMKEKLFKGYWIGEHVRSGRPTALMVEGRTVKWSSPDEGLTEKWKFRNEGKYKVIVLQNGNENREYGIIFYGYDSLHIGSIPVVVSEDSVSFEPQWTFSRSKKESYKKFLTTFSKAVHDK